MLKHVHVHLNFTCIGLVTILLAFLVSFPHTLFQSYLLYKLEQNLCFSVHIYILEFYNVMIKYGALNM